MGKEPLDNPDVRRALRYCFDVEAINNASFRGQGTHTWNPFNLYAGNDGPEPRTSPTTSTKAKAAARRRRRHRHHRADPVHRRLRRRHRRRPGAPAVVPGRPGSTCEVEVAEAADWLDRTYTDGTWEGITFNAGNLPFPSKNFFDYLVNPSAILSDVQGGRRGPRRRRAVPRDQWRRRSTTRRSTTCSCRPSR